MIFMIIWLSGSYDMVTMMLLCNTMYREVVMVLLIVALIIALSVVVIKRAVIDYYKTVIGK